MIKNKNSDIINDNTFYGRFMKLCIDKNETPTHVSEKIGLSRGTVSSWKKKLLERGEDVSPDGSTIRRICDYFGVSETWLRGIPDPPVISDRDLKIALFGIPNANDKLLDNVKSYALWLLKNDV